MNIKSADSTLQIVHVEIAVVLAFVVDVHVHHVVLHDIHVHRHIHIVAHHIVLDVIHVHSSPRHGKWPWRLVHLMRLLVGVCYGSAQEAEASSRSVKTDDQRGVLIAVDVADSIHNVEIWGQRRW